MKIGKYEYPDDVMETVKIKKTVRDEINEFCQIYNIIKSKLVENFYKKILKRFRDGSLEASKGYFSINVLAGSVRQRQ